MKRLEQSQPGSLCGLKILLVDIIIAREPKVNRPRQRKTKSRCPSHSSRREAAIVKCLFKELVPQVSAKKSDSSLSTKYLNETVQSQLTDLTPKGRRGRRTLFFATNPYIFKIFKN